MPFIRGLLKNRSQAKQINLNQKSLEYQIPPVHSKTNKMLSPHAQEDIREFYSVYNPDKLEMVPVIIAQANKKSLSAPDIFNSLYGKYDIQKIPTRMNVMLSLKQQFPAADDELILSVLRNVEFKQAPAESAPELMAARLEEINRQQRLEKEKALKEAQEAQRRQQEDIRRREIEHERLLKEEEEARRRQREEEEASSPPTPTEYDEPTLHHSPPAMPAPSSSAKTAQDVRGEQKKSTHPTPSPSAAPEEKDPLLPYGPKRAVSSMPSKQKVETLMGEELREWLVGMVGDYFDLTAKSGGLLNGGHRLRSEANVCDALRDGAVLAILQQRLRNPAIAAGDLKKPRTQGFFGRENTSIFIDFCRREYQMKDELLFTDSDLCDAKNDKMAINSLLTLAGIVYKRAKDQQEIQRRAAKEAAARYGSAVAIASPAPAAASIIRAPVPMLVRYEEEITTQAQETSAEAVEAAVKNALQEEVEEEERASKINRTPQRNPSFESSGGMLSPSQPPTASPSQDLIVALQRQREALEKQREAEMEAERKRAELERLEKESYEEAERAAREQRDHAIRAEKERQLFEVIEMKRRWIANQIQFLQGQAAADRKGLEVAEEHTRYKLQEQIRQQARFLLDRSRSDRPLPITTVASPSGGIYAPSPARHYVPAKGDEIDKKVSRAVNRVFGRHAYSQTRIKKLAHSGEYVVFHKITGKRTVVYVRDVRENLMIRVGGGWDDFEGWLERHVNIGLEGEMTPQKEMNIARGKNSRH